MKQRTRKKIRSFVIITVILAMILTTFLPIFASAAELDTTTPSSEAYYEDDYEYVDPESVEVHEEITNEEVDDDFIIETDTDFWTGGEKDLRPNTNESPTTIKDIIGEDNLNIFDPVQLINLAILNSVNVNTVKYNNMTIFDTLNEEQRLDIAFSESTVSVYKSAVDDAKKALANGIGRAEVIKYAGEASRLYNDYIATFANIKVTKDEVKQAILEYLRAYEIGEMSAGVDLNTLKTHIIKYTLTSIVAQEKPEIIEIDTSIGVLDTPQNNYYAEFTTWATNDANFVALFGGTVTEISNTSITLSLGNDNHNLSITYSNPDKIILLDKNTKVGSNFKQGTEFISGDTGLVTIKASYNDIPIDIIPLLGNTGKMLMSEYKRFSIDEYSDIKENYVNYILMTKFNN